jgi:imidazolonepropionase-like amidohydrolase
MHMPMILTALFLAVASAAGAQTCDRSPLRIANVNLWTPQGIVTGRDVIVRDGRIAGVIASGSARPNATRAIDGSGSTLLPGLIDSHLHFSVPGGLPNPPRPDTDQITARQLLRSGVTSGRLHLAALDDAIRLKAASQDPCAAMPRLQAGGPGLSGALEKDFSAFQAARSVDEAIGKVQKFAAAGVDWLAVHDGQRFPPGVLEAIASAARKANVRVMASGSTPEEIAAALSIDPDTLDYFDRTPAAGYSDALLSAIRARTNMILVPTPGVPYRIVAYSRQPQRLDEAQNFELFADADRAFVLANAKKDLDGAEAKRSVDVVPTIANKLRQLRSLGLPVAIGSDAGSTLQFQPNSIWWELEAWRAAGASHRDALIAATVNGARVLKLEDVGHLRPGARGDFVVYRGNVEEGAFDAARVIAVGKDGVVFRQPQGR